MAKTSKRSGTKSVKKHTFIAGFIPNFETLKRASANGDLALVECRDALSQELVACVCAVGFENDEYVIVPIARMITGNPYEQLEPPNDDGGFHPADPTADPTEQQVSP